MIYIMIYFSWRERKEAQMSRRKAQKYSKEDGCFDGQYPHCLECPMPLCKYDSKAAFSKWHGAQRRKAAWKMFQLSLKPEAIAASLGISSRMIRRDLRFVRRELGLVPKRQAEVRETPKEDEMDRLLTPEEIDRLYDQWSQEMSPDISKKLGNTFSQAITEAQAARTARLKDEEWQEKIQELFKELETKILLVKEVVEWLKTQGEYLEGMPFITFCIDVKDWETLLRGEMPKKVKEKDLPTPGELRGMSPDFTGGLTTEEYLHKMREG